MANLVQWQILRLKVSVVVADGVVEAGEEEPGHVEAQVKEDDDLTPTGKVRIRRQINGSFKSL